LKNDVKFGWSVGSVHDDSLLLAADRDSSTCFNCTARAQTWR
jgi:hypothetical protein